MRCETWKINLIERVVLEVFVKRVLGRIYGRKKGGGSLEKENK